MKSGFCVFALLIKATLTLGKIYIKEELVQNVPALDIRDVETDILRTHTHTPAYSSEKSPMQLQYFHLRQACLTSVIAQAAYFLTVEMVRNQL
jgi:hypothetical protein